MKAKMATSRFELGWSEGVFGAFQLFCFDFVSWEKKGKWG
jgi:hypothetical protein